MIHRKFAPNYVLCISWHIVRKEIPYFLQWANNYQAKQLKELIIKKLRRGYYLYTCIDPCMHACIMSYNVAGIYLVVFMQRLL